MVMKLNKLKRRLTTHERIIVGITAGLRCIDALQRTINNPAVSQTVIMDLKEIQKSINLLLYY